MAKSRIKTEVTEIKTVDYSDDEVRVIVENHARRNNRMANGKSFDRSAVVSNGARYEGCDLSITVRLETTTVEENEHDGQL